MSEQRQDLARVAYESYASERDWVSHNGEALPSWGSLTPPIQAGWLAAADAVTVKVIFDAAVQATLGKYMQPRETDTCVFCARNIHRIGEGKWRHESGSVTCD